MEYCIQSRFFELTEIILLNRFHVYVVSVDEIENIKGIISKGS